MAVKCREKGDPTMNKETIKKITEAYESQFNEIAAHLFEHPELSGEEYASATYLKEQLTAHEFKINDTIEGLPTAFVATYTRSNGSGEKTPVIAFLAEYDALPGYGPNQEPAHACGHNWIAASACGAAITLSKMGMAAPSTIMVIGTPAEETVGGKIDMVRLGIFNEVDVVIQCHPEIETQIETRTLAMDAIEFSFEGKASHVAQYPHEGINALDAVLLTYAGINALRQHVKPDVRIHGIITKGGDAPNIVPKEAVCKFYVRANERKELNGVTEKVINCAKGAALMTGASLSFEYFENPFDNLYHVRSAQNIFAENLNWAEVADISMEPEALPGSSDIGNVSHVVPTVYANVKVSRGASVHEAAFLEEIVSPFAYEQLKKAIQAMAGTAYEIILNPSLLKLIQEEFVMNRRR